MGERENAMTDGRGTPKSRPLILDASAESANPHRPAFLARPEGTPVYHGFPVVEGVEVDGFRLGMITDFESSPEDGDAFVVAPDGDRAGLVLCRGCRCLGGSVPAGDQSLGRVGRHVSRSNENQGRNAAQFGGGAATPQGEMAPLEGAIPITGHRPHIPPVVGKHGG